MYTSQIAVYCNVNVVHVPDYFEIILICMEPGRTSVLPGIFLTVPTFKFPILVSILMNCNLCIPRTSIRPTQDDRA